MNPWITHVKAVAAEKGISYTQALKVASSTYKKKTKTTSTPKKTPTKKTDVAAPMTTTGCGFIPIYADWETAWLEKNEDEFVDMVKKIKYVPPLPEPYATAINIIRNYPKGSVEVKKAFNKITRAGSPRGIYDTMFNLASGGAVSGGDEVKTATTRVKKILDDENVKRSSFGLVRSIINLVKVVATKDSQSVEKIAAGKDVFISFVATSIVAILAAYGLANPLTIMLVDGLTPVVAGALYDFIVRKIQEQKKKKMRGGVVVDELPYHPDILTNIIETYFYLLNLELDKFM